MDRGRFGIGAECRLQVGVIREVLRRVEQVRSPVLGIAREYVVIRPDVGTWIGRHLGMVGIDQIAIRSDVLQTVESHVTTLDVPWSDVVGRSRIGVDAKGIDQISIGSDVF